MKTCLIYGQNGLDYDVALNLVWFYERLGFMVAITDYPNDADLLVVLRARDAELIIDNINISIMHVYDYGGWDFDGFVRSVDKTKTWIFCTSEHKRQRLIDILQFPEEKVFLALPPVDVSRWSNRLKRVSYELVHIGHYKRVDNDKVNILFNDVIRSFRVHVWGAGWADFTLNGYLHGKLGLFKVSSIYSRSKNSLGLMYPFQRDSTYSGRFWHAPLNGCRVLSEPGLYSNKIPGIVETDYSHQDIESKLKIPFDREELQLLALNFWMEQEGLTRDIVNMSINNIGERSIKVYELMNYLRLRLLMNLRKTYQYLSLFKLFEMLF